MRVFVRPILRARVIRVPLLLFAFATTSGAETASSAQLAPAPAPAPARTPVPIGLPESAAQEPALRRLTPRGETSVDDTDRRSRLPSTGSAIASLAIVLIVVLAALRLWKSVGPTVSNNVAGSAAEVLGRCRIEQRQSLYLVRIGSRILVLGSGGGELTTLSEISDPAEVDLVAGMCRSQGGTASPFARMFEARRAVESPAVEQEGADTSPFSIGTRPFRSATPSPEERLAHRLKARPADREADRVA